MSESHPHADRGEASSSVASEVTAAVAPSDEAPPSVCSSSVPPRRRPLGCGVADEDDETAAVSAENGGLGVLCGDADPGEKRVRGWWPRRGQRRNTWLLPHPSLWAGRLSSSFARSCLESKRLKTCATAVMGAALVLFLLDVMFAPPESRILKPSDFGRFLGWVQSHPVRGLAAFVVVYGCTVVLLLPGTPLTIGAGYIYKAAYGWGTGVAVASIFSTLGSLLGSVTCFLLGRYLMRDVVRSWVRKYPLFTALDAAVAERGFKIMALLYLTPVLPLGPVSYMCGTTSMFLAHFAAAKIACVPLMVFYVFLGASAGALLHGKSTAGTGTEPILSQGLGRPEEGGGAPGSTGDAVLDLMTEGESVPMIVFGVCLSALSVVLISRVVKKELMKVLDEQKRSAASASSLDFPGLSVEKTFPIEVVADTSDVDNVRQRVQKMGAVGGRHYLQSDLSSSGAKEDGRRKMKDGHLA